MPAEELQNALNGLAPEQITGPGGLLTQLAGRVVETALGEREVLEVRDRVDALKRPGPGRACGPPDAAR